MFHFQVLAFYQSLYCIYLWLLWEACKKKFAFIKYVNMLLVYNENSLSNFQVKSALIAPCIFCLYLMLSTLVNINIFSIEETNIKANFPSIITAKTDIPSDISFFQELDSGFFQVLHKFQESKFKT